MTAAAFFQFLIRMTFVVALLVVCIVGAGVYVAPFEWDAFGLPRDPVPVDAIPDYGENQQIVFTQWGGRSPQDVEDQVTYPLTAALLGIPGVKTTRSYSYMGYSSIHVIFHDHIEYYWSRTRVLEKLSSLPTGTVPDGVKPALGPDATALGQIYWYTLEGRDESGNAAGGWDLEELRSIQDWQVRFALMSVEGVSEASSVGGFVREYQIDVDPDALRVHGVRLDEVFQAVRLSNIDVGARTIEVNRAEYVIRGIGFLENVDDIESTVIKVSDNVPICVRDVARVSEGPALRRGALDKDGVEAVGGVVVVRYGENPLATIRRLKDEIEAIAGGLPEKVLADGTLSKVTIVPFYDRTGLIRDTLGTLNKALADEILVAIIVVLAMVLHVRGAMMISALLAVAILMTFIGMKSFGVDANIVALSGIAIAIGTMVDVGIVICENILQGLKKADPSERRDKVVARSCAEVSGAVLTSIATTVVGFLPVFALDGAEGKLFKPLAYTKTFALVAAVLIALVAIPPFANLIFAGRFKRAWIRDSLAFGALAVGAVVLTKSVPLGIVLIVVGGWHLLDNHLSERARKWGGRVAVIVAILTALVILAGHWSPLGVEKGLMRNLVFAGCALGGAFGVILLFQRFYEPILRLCLQYKLAFLLLPLSIFSIGILIWRGMGNEFMPTLSEGTFLYMPTTMPHASIGESMDALRKQDTSIRSIPEVDFVVGKIGRVDSALDPAPISMMETIVQYKPEYKITEDGQRVRQWRDHIRTPDDIWREIERAGRVLGSTSAPKLQPIEARLVMLQTGMRAPMGIKVFGPDLETLETVAIDIEKLLREIPSVRPETVAADRVVGKPYLEIEIDRHAIARYGLSVRQVQDVIEVAIGGKTLTTMVLGRERYPVRVRYLRELRDSPESLQRIIVPTPNGTRVPLGEIAEIIYKRGPVVIKSEKAQLVAYVTFDKKDGYAEVETAEQVAAYLKQAKADGRLKTPDGATHRVSGNYENQVRSAKRLMVVVPLSLLIIIGILYFQFHSLATTLFVFTGVFVAWSGGFMMLWLYGQDWFLDFAVFGENMRHLFQVRPYHLSVAVWVGFLALFGIATDDGVVMGTYLDQSFRRRTPGSVAEVREAVVAAGKRRIRPCLMTVATTILALIPVLTSTGRGSDVMVPMAIPTFGGMSVALITVLIVPTLYCLKEELKLRRGKDQTTSERERE